MGGGGKEGNDQGGVTRCNQPTNDGGIGESNPMKQLAPGRRRIEFRLILIAETIGYEDGRWTNVLWDPRQQLRVGAIAF